MLINVKLITIFYLLTTRMRPEEVVVLLVYHSRLLGLTEFYFCGEYYVYRVSHCSLSPRK